MNTAVLFLIFNRPDTTQRVFDEIKKAKPPRLYIAADGPRNNKLGEKEKCEEARAIHKQIDWPCEVKILFRENNLGCKKAVSEAINWFFEYEEEGIILEDDVLPHYEFFRFCEDLLNRYRNNESIGVISGHNHVYNSTSFNGNKYDYVVVSHCWGWATWRKSWQTVDISLNKYSLSSLSNRLKKLYSIKSYRRFWKAIFQQCKQNRINSWAYPMTLSFIINGKLSIIPCLNLTKNIGDGEDATHTSRLNPKEQSVHLNGIYPLNHPTSVNLNKAAEIEEITNENRYLSFSQYTKVKVSLILYKLGLKK